MFCACPEPYSIPPYKTLSLPILTVAPRDDFVGLAGTFTSQGLTIIIDASLAILQNRPKPVGSEWLNGLPQYRDLRWSLARSFCHSHWAQR